MKIKNYSYILWCWFTTIAFFAIVIATALISDLQSNTAGEEVVKVAFRMLLYAVTFILLYRSIIATLRASVSRLAKWRNRSEAAEDAEFVLIIETLVVIISIVVMVLLAVSEVFISGFQPGRVNEVQEQLRDILVSIMSILLTALVVYTIPAIGELEFAIKRKLEKELAPKKKSSKKTSKE